MIGELELELAIAEAERALINGEHFAFMVAEIDRRPVEAYARRFAQVKEAGGAPYIEAAGGGFMLGFRLGVLAARHEPKVEQ